MEEGYPVCTLFDQFAHPLFCKRHTTFEMLEKERKQKDECTRHEFDSKQWANYGLGLESSRQH